MGTWFQYPPGGGVAAPLPTAGLNNDFSFRGGRLANITFVVTVGTATFQYFDERDTPSAAVVIAAGQGYHDLNRKVQRLNITGTGTCALQLNTPPADVDVKTLLSQVSGTVTIGADNTGIAGAVTNQWSNFPLNRAPVYTTGGAQKVIPQHDLGP